MDFIKIQNILHYDSLSQLIDQLDFHVLSYGYLDYQKPFVQEDNILANYKIVIMDKGSAQLTFQRYQYTLNQGDAVLLPPFIYYSLTATHPTAHYYFYFDTQQIQQSLLLASLFPKQCHVAKQLMNDKLLSILKNQHEVIQNMDFGKYSLVNSMIQSLITLMANNLKNGVSFNLQNHSNSIMNTIQQALNYIDTNIHQPIYVNEIADTIGISSSYLNHCFHEVYYISTKQFIDAYRFHQIIIELTQTDLSISSIAENYGFASLYAFSNAFKKVYNQSPTTYRKLFKSTTNH